MISAAQKKVQQMKVSYNCSIQCAGYNRIRYTNLKIYQMNSDITTQFVAERFSTLQVFTT
jgi:hypothetical protein